MLTIRRKYGVVLSLIFIVFIIISNIILNKFFYKNFKEYITNDMKKNYEVSVSSLNDYLAINNINKNEMTASDLNNNVIDFILNRAYCQGALYDLNGKLLLKGVINEKELDLNIYSISEETLNIVKDNKAIIDIERRPNSIIGKVSYLIYGKNGIWNYDIDNKKLTKIVDVDSETFFDFHINENKDKVVISSLKYSMEKDGKQNNTLSIADINDKLEITNITNIVTNTEERHHKAFAGFANGGKTFYVRSTIADESYNATNKLEVYNIVE